MLMYRVGQDPQRRFVIRIPELDLRIRRGIRRRVNREYLGAYRGPPALRLHAAHCGMAVREDGAEAVAVGNLVETVLERHRAQSNGLEQNVVTRIARHSTRPK